jgi:hypothetical protein
MEQYWKKGVSAKRSTEVPSTVSVETVKLIKESGKGHIIRKIHKIYKTEDFLNKQQSPYFFKQFTCMSWNPQWLNHPKASHFARLSLIESTGWMGWTEFRIKMRSDDIEGAIEDSRKWLTIFGRPLPNVGELASWLFWSLEWLHDISGSSCSRENLNYRIKQIRANLSITKALRILMLYCKLNSLLDSSRWIATCFWQFSRVHARVFPWPCTAWTCCHHDEFPKDSNHLGWLWPDSNDTVCMLRHDGDQRKSRTPFGMKPQ